MRYRTFTAFLSISFLIAGLGASNATANDPAVVDLPLFGTKPVAALAFVLGFLFFCFSWFFYWWYHRYSHLYRDRLKGLEKSLDIEVYRLRSRKTMKVKSKTAKFHFDWSLRILGLWYGIVAIAYAGPWLVLSVIAVSLGLYGIFLWRSTAWPVEPNEPSGSHD